MPFEGGGNLNDLSLRKPSAACRYHIQHQHNETSPRRSSCQVAVTSAKEWQGRGNPGTMGVRGGEVPGRMRRKCGEQFSRIHRVTLQAGQVWPFLGEPSSPSCSSSSIVASQSWLCGAVRSRDLLGPVCPGTCQDMHSLHSSHKDSCAGYPAQEDELQELSGVICQVGYAQLEPQKGEERAL